MEIFCVQPELSESIAVPMKCPPCSSALCSKVSQFDIGWSGPSPWPPPPGLSAFGFVLPLWGVLFWDVVEVGLVPAKSETPELPPSPRLGLGLTVLVWFELGEALRSSEL